MTVVVDVGCARYGDDQSVERLIEEFHPDVLYGFDPNDRTRVTRVNGCEVAVFRKAAWVADGEVGFHEDRLRSALTDDPAAPRVPAIDLAEFIVGLGPERVVLKIDAEGAEYVLLEHLIREGVDVALDVAVVEWHDLPDGSHDARRAAIEETIGCELREWAF